MAGATFVFGIFFLFTQREQKLVLLPGIEKDSIPPLTAVVTPKAGSWHRMDFIVEIRDSDLGSGLGDAGILGKRCEYFIEDLETKARGGDYRTCGESFIQVPVGQGKVCSSSYDTDSMIAGKCLVHTRAFDKTGNDSGWKATLFNIDLIPPSVGSITLSSSKIDPLKAYLFEARISDNAHITGCTFYVDNSALESISSVTPSPCENGTQCIASVKYIFETAGLHNITFGCKDAAGNVGYGAPFSLNVFVNSPPEINFCRVAPAQGTTATQFQFSTATQDSDGDTLRYEWDFGDGTTSQDQHPSHMYKASGTYTPKLRVQDHVSTIDECSTAWVVVHE